ncbi:MAG: hypothetical protein SWH54_01305 [Thermodesulfobacteriota bacterium]|nr:hypothetical protein [Thermodesulfobacteriota bacterium]
MNSNQAIFFIFDELREGQKKYPDWPEDPVLASAILAAESSKLSQACIDYADNKASDEKMIKEAAQAGAAAIRFIMNMAKYRRTKPDQD